MRSSPLSSAATWRVRLRRVSLDRPIVFGILNVTPDSFSDGGRFVTPDAALGHAERMLDEGADAIDVGGESTRPQGAAPVDVDEERRRVTPIVRELVRRFPDALVSVDTVKADVAAAVLDVGAHIINDVAAFRLDRRMGDVCARAGAGVVLMHSRGTVSDMGTYAHADYGADVTGEMLDELSASVDAARDAGVAADAIAVDPGVGFAKRSEHSLRILGELPRLVSLGYPVLIGASRKRFVGEISGVATPAERAHGTVGANVAALMLGARMFRVHDVRANREALDVAWAVLTAAETDSAPATVIAAVDGR